MTFKAWWDIFFKTYLYNVVAFDSWQEYCRIIKCHFTIFWEMELNSIKPLHIRECLNTTLNYSTSRQRKAYFLLKRVFDEAINNEYAEKNPVEKLKPPKGVKKNVEVFELEHLELIFEDDDEITRMLKLELLTGLRRGELLALEWKNINLDEKVINVCQTIVRTENGEQLVNTTKSRKDRIVTLNDTAVEVLQKIKSE